MTASSHKLDDAFERAVLGDDSPQIVFDDDGDDFEFEGAPFTLDHDAKFDLALLGALDPVQVDEVAPDAEFDAVMIGSGAVVVPPPPRPVIIQPPPLKIVEPPPLAARPAPKMKVRDYSLSFGFVWGSAGFVTTITIRPQCRFSTEKLMATDTYSTPGFGTSVIQVAIGQKVQRPGSAGRGTLSTFFSQTALADGITLDTAHPWESIALTISFIQECTFHGSMFGSAEVE